MTIKSTMKKKIKWKPRAQSAEAMREHYREMQEAAIAELHFANTQISELLGVLTAFEDYPDNLVKSLAKNAKEKHHLNKILHSKKLFW